MGYTEGRVGTVGYTEVRVGTEGYTEGRVGTEGYTEGRVQRGKQRGGKRGAHRDDREEGGIGMRQEKEETDEARQKLGKGIPII